MAEDQVVEIGRMVTPTCLKKVFQKTHYKKEKRGTVEYRGKKMGRGGGKSQESGS